MRIGLLGGTFNPVHNGHITIAEEAVKRLNLDKVVFIPTYIPPHKESGELVDAEDRYAMLKLAIGEREEFEILRFEIDKKEKSYSIDTLEQLRSLYPLDAEFFFLIGADSLEGLSSWKDIDRLHRLCKFVAFNRPDFSQERAYPEVEKITIEPVDISSTEIRRRVREDESIEGLLSKNIEGYINTKNLYKKRGES